MKLITLEKHGPFETKGALMMILNQKPQGMMLDEMRKRIAIMDKLDAASVSVVLKTDEFTFLTNAINGFAFSVAHKDLLAVVDGVLASGDAPAPMLESKGNGAAEPASASA